MSGRGDDLLGVEVSVGADGCVERDTRRGVLHLISYGILYGKSANTAPPGSLISGGCPRWFQLGRRPQGRGLQGSPGRQDSAEAAHGGWPASSRCRGVRALRRPRLGHHLTLTALAAWVARFPFCRACKASPYDRTAQISEGCTSRWFHRPVWPWLKPGAQLGSPGWNHRDVDAASELAPRPPHPQGSNPSHRQGWWRFRPFWHL